ncbi:MAG: YciI family protein [Synechococcus sp.]|nr:YciI family protein [Synechococcus sp.]
MARFVLWGTYCADALEKRGPYRDEHLARLQSLKDEGCLITLGPTEGSTHVFGIFEAETLDSVQQLVEADVYWKEGIWTAVKVYPWIQAF